MAKPVKLNNGRIFRSQTAALDHFRQILDFYKNNQIIADVSHHSDLVALLERYDSAITDTPSKIGVGIRHFERRINADDAYATAGFWVVRTDGSDTDFSFYTGVKGVPKSHSEEFTDACRGAVASDLKKSKEHHFKVHGDKHGQVRCEITDEPISYRDADLDHAHPTFGVMVVMFLAEHGWRGAIPSGVLTRGQDRQTTTTFADPEIARKFREFHHQNASIRIISRRCNLALAHSQRMPTLAGADSRNAPKILRPVKIVQE